MARVRPEIILRSVGRLFIVHCPRTFLRGLRTLFLAAILVGLSGAPGRAQGDLQQALKAEQAALDSLKARLKANQNRLKKTETARRTVADALAQQEQDIVRVRAELGRMTRQEEDLSRRLGGTRAELNRVEERLQARQEGMAQRLREIYKLTRRGRLQILFSAASFSDALMRLHYLARVAGQDRKDYEAIQADRARIQGVLALQQAQHAHQRVLVEAKQGAEVALRSKVADHARQLRRLKSDASAMSRAIRDNQRAIAESDEKIRRLIQNLQAQQRLTALPAFDFPAHRGKLRRPVAGRVLSRFGRHQDPELKTWTFNRGVNLAAPEGADVMAVAPGQVVLVDWFPGYGQFVLLRHPGGFYTLYGHLERVLVNTGEILAAGTVLGKVGSTGRLDGVPQLHFELMKGEEPLDPLKWLAR